MEEWCLVWVDQVQPPFWFPKYGVSLWKAQPLPTVEFTILSLAHETCPSNPSTPLFLRGTL